MATLSGGTKAERFGFIKRYSNLHSVKKLCKHLNVSRSGYYQWLRRKPSARACSDGRLLHDIRRIFERSQGRYGSPKVYRILKSEGWTVSCKRVARLMRETGLKARVDRVYRRMKKSRAFFRGLENHRLSISKATEINQQWSGDVTYIKVGQRWGYLAVVIDLYSRKIIGWAVGERLNADLTVLALSKAIRSRKPSRGLLFHTDRGREYCADRVQKLLVKNGIKHSMNRPGQCTDNAEVESFFKTLKGELIKNTPIRNLTVLAEKLRKYIDYFYNRTRIHSSVGYVSPIQFEKQLV